MNTIWRSLLWKEWCENRWKLASLVAILFALPLYILWDEPSMFYRCALMVSMCYVFVAPIFIGAGVCASEASAGTLPYLQATPVDRMKWAFAKLVMGLFTVIVPLLLLLIFAGVLNRFESRDVVEGSDEPTLFLLFVWALLLPASMFIWSLAAGVNRSRELWAIACSLGVFMALWMTFSFVDLKLPYFSSLWRTLAAALPGGIGIASFEASRLLPTLPIALVALVSHGGLLAWYLTQYGRSTRHAGHSPKAVVVRDPASVVICEPRKSRLSAILWMQMQEIAPLAAACVAIILLPALLFANFENELRGDTYTQRLGEMLIGMTGTMGFLFATLIGVGVFLRDLEPGLNTFWRSRPISANQWFWTKYLSALAMLILAISVPGIVALLLNWENIQLDKESIAIAVLVVTVFLTTYSVAVSTTALVRHTIYGCILSMGIVLVSFAIPAETLDADNWSDEVRFGVVLAVQIILIAAATLLAWLAVTRDWGWKR